MANELIEGKRVLVVDDEPDVLESLKEILSMCDVVKATSFEEAKKKLDSESFDVAVLDIMGVEGFRLLEIAVERGILSVMLTAHALNPETTIEAYKKGAAYYIPKEKMNEIATYLNDILDAQEKNMPFWWRWLERFGAYYDKKFGMDWKNKDKDFWESLKYYDRV